VGGLQPYDIGFGGSFDGFAMSEIDEHENNDSHYICIFLLSNNFSYIKLTHISFM
jgi:hypothetical protein